MSLVLIEADIDPLVAAIPEPIKRMMFAEAPIVLVGEELWTERTAA